MRPEKIQSAARTCPDTRTPFRLHRLGIVKRPLKIHNVPREEVQRVAEDVYIYGYPLLLMDVMRRMHTAVPFPRFPSAPVNHFAHGRLLPGPHSKDVVRPHADMLCSSAWLDLSKEPVVLSIPRTDRYYLLSIWSAWYEIFEAISPRNTGPEGGSFVFVGPQWSGRLPDDLKMVQAPTETVWIDGRFQAAGVEDIQVVHRMQDHFRLVPLTQWGKPPSSHSIPFRLDVDQAGTPEEQVARYDAPAFYKRLARLMLKNPAQACDAEMVAEFAWIGFFPGDDFAFEMLPAATVQAMHLAVPAAQVRIANAEKSAVAGKVINSWSLNLHPGRFEADYISRAVAARSGVAVALAEDMVCFQTAVDHTGEPLNGANQYVIHFSRERIPPVNAFWSITLYDSKQHVVQNNIHRHVIGDHDRLRLNSDNSLSIYIQHEWPGMNREFNWLPAPKDSFNLVVRMYWPKPDVFSGRWRPPAVMRMN